MACVKIIFFQKCRNSKLLYTIHGATQIFWSHCLQSIPEPGQQLKIDYCCILRLRTCPYSFCLYFLDLARTRCSIKRKIQPPWNDDEEAIWSFASHCRKNPYSFFGCFSLKRCWWPNQYIQYSHAAISCISAHCKLFKKNYISLNNI